jgi:hypothetical protein
MGEAGETPRPISTHLRFAAVTVVISHAEVGAVSRSLQQQNSIRAHAAVPIANPRNLLGIEMNPTIPIVDQDEIVAGAVHLRESQHTFV